MKELEPSYPDAKPAFQRHHRGVKIDRPIGRMAQKILKQTIFESKKGIKIYLPTPMMGVFPAFNPVAATSYSLVAVVVVGMLHQTINNT